MMARVETIGNRESSVEANMGQARKWVSVALAGLVAASLSLAAPGPSRAAEDVLNWRVSGSVEAGGMYSFGEHSSSKFNEYRDMDNGFIGGLSLEGEHKTSPYHFDLNVTNPARDDQKYEGGFGRYGLFQLDLGWNRTPHVLTDSAQTIFQEQSHGVFTLPSTLRGTIATDTNAGPCGATVSWNCPVEYGRSSPDISSAQSDFIRDTINGLRRPVDLKFNTDVGNAEFSLTPTEELRFDLGYENIRRQGYRPVGVVIGSPGGSVTELAIPIDNMTHEVKFGAEYARESYALQFGYTASIFRNEYDSYTWDNPGYFGTTDSSDFVNAAGRAVRVNQGQISAPPDNVAHTFNLTGTAALPLRSRISGSFAYSMLRQDQTFLTNTMNRAIAQSNTDDSGNSSPDAKADILMGNVQLTSRPLSNVTGTARYRYFEYQNDTPFHSFTTALGNPVVPEGLGTADASSKAERFTKQNAGADLGWRPIRAVGLKGGYEYEHWNRGDYDSHSSDEHTGKFAADLTPIDWFLGRVTYSYSQRTVKDYEAPEGELPQFVKFDQADRRRNRVDVLMQFSPWETVTPSLSFGYAKDDYYHSSYGLKDNDYWTAGASLGWSPLDWLQFSADYAYERYKYNQGSRYRPVYSTPAQQAQCPAGSLDAASGLCDDPTNDWNSSSKDEFHTVGVNADLSVIPKKLDLTLGYAITLGYTTISANNLSTPTDSGGIAYNWDRIQNVLQTVKVVAKYHFTKKFMARLGYAYERYTEKDFARDPMQQYMGDVDTSNAGIQSVFLGTMVPNYEAHILSFFLKYDF